MRIIGILQVGNANPSLALRPIAPIPPLDRILEVRKPFGWKHHLIPRHRVPVAPLKVFLEAKLPEAADQDAVTGVEDVFHDF